MNWKRTLVIAVAIGLALALSAPAQTIEQVITAFDGSHTLTRPVQLALSPAGSSVAVSDQHGNRIYICDIDGRLAWIVGEATPVAEPIAVCFDGEDVVLFSVRASLAVFRVAKATPNTIDTVIDLAGVLPKDATIDQIVGLKDKGYLVLDRHRSSVYKFKANWEKDKELISRGGRKGELWSPHGLATDLSGNIVVADEGSFPMQTFSPAGRFLFFGGWNAAQPERVWNASAVAITRDEQIWVADATNAQWRVFDRTGSEIGRYAFQQPIFYPNAVVATPDNRLIVADERGSVIFVRLP